MSRFAMACAVIIGAIMGFVPGLGQILGIAAYWEGQSGNEMARYAYGFVAGCVVGTAAMVVTFLIVQ